MWWFWKGFESAENQLIFYLNKKSISHYAAMLIDPRVKNTVYHTMGLNIEADEMWVMYVSFTIINLQNELT